MIPSIISCRLLRTLAGWAALIMIAGNIMAFEEEQGIAWLKAAGVVMTLS